MLEDKFITVQDSKIHYIEDGNGTPIIFCHGARFNARTYEETGTIQTAVDAGYHAISVDFPGYGKSENLSTDLFTFISEFMEAMKLEQAVVLGASMGGEAAIGFATKYPEKTRALILVGAVGVTDMEAGLSMIADKPTLLIWGKNDAISAPSNYEIIMRYNTAAEFANIGRQHACYLDDPKGFNDRIKAFLEELRGK
ncbi:alpha/beta hydrolase [Ferroplasma sp.]|uniref:alpha/beta fold hydrolase n=1 Tax=Ferroplasma sp. TaxID=2591003 RepID=UPI002602CDB3|nr:alpha/beta hydrolase [Ferroplasma sp.]MCL4453810.1 alpha/beta hydrolase [Candidatus Thermoplasmatota archaeon]